MSKKVDKADEAWRDQLTPEQYEVARCGGTEPPFQNPYWDCKEDGIYRCVCCEAELFDSASKYDSGTGWPSFDRPMNGDAVTNHADTSLGMARNEVCCSQCGAHLGHVFPDGPPSTGERYCMNSASLDFRPKTES